MTAVDRYPHGYPDYDRPVALVRYHSDGRLIGVAVRIVPGPTPQSRSERNDYGRHSHADTKSAKRSDLRQWHRVQDAIRSQAAERGVLVSSGRRVVRRSA